MDAARHGKISALSSIRPSLPSKNNRICGSEAAFGSIFGIRETSKYMGADGIVAVRNTL